MGSAPQVGLADGVVRALVDQGIDTIFGIGGTHTLQLLGAIERASSIDFVPARTELGAAYMAIGWAKTTRRPAVVLTSTGPGALNVIAALEDASWSCTPLIHLTTSIGGREFGGAVHETPNQQPILGLASKSLVHLDPDDVMGSVARAVADAQAMPSGPVTLDVPAGRWDELVELAPVGAPDAPAGEVGSRDLEDLVAELARARRPLVFAGGGALPQDGGAAVLRLAECLGAPVITSHQARTIGSTDQPGYLGPWGSEPEVQRLAAGADLALVFGSKLSALGTGGWQLPLPAFTYWIDPKASAHPRYPSLRNVRADAASVARALEVEVTSRGPWVDVDAVRRSVRTAKGQTHPVEISFIDALAAAPDGARHLTADMSKAGFWTMKFLEAPAGSVHGFSSYLAMGTALPMAIGIAVASQQPVVSIVGDGALQMSMAELATLASLELPIRVVVIVDHAYGILRDNCAAVGGSESLGVDLWNPDLVKLGEAFGMTVLEASDPEALAEHLLTEIDGPQMILAHQEFTREW